MWMRTTNRQEAGCKYTLFVVLKGVEIAFRKTNGFFLSPLQTCGQIGGDASQILTLFQKKNNFRLLQSMWKAQTLSPVGQLVLKRYKTSSLLSPGHREEAVLFPKARFHFNFGIILITNQYNPWSFHFKKISSASHWESSGEYITHSPCPQEVHGIVRKSRKQLH